MNQKALERRLKKHIIAGRHTLYFSVIPGLEEATVKELSRFELEAVKLNDPGSLEAAGSLEQLWKAVSLAQTPSRVYLRLLSFKAGGFREFRNKTEDYPWELYLSEGCEYRLRFSLSHCRLHVTDNIGKSLKRSINERFEKQGGLVPTLIEETASHVESSVQTILIRGVDDRFQLSLDAGGGPLYDRGYRQFINEAPLRETLAASLLQIMDISDKTTLIDPMCGSGTFALEALVMTSQIPVYPDRRFPFEYWPSFKPSRYEWHMEQHIKKRQPACKIFSSDKDPRSLNAARANRELFQNKWNGSRYNLTIKELLKNWEIEEKDFLNTSFSGVDESVLILNPPYGLRLKLENRKEFFSSLGKKIRRDYRGCRWGILVPDIGTEKFLGLKWDKKYILSNGGLKVAFLTGRS